VDLLVECVERALNDRGGIAIGDLVGE